MNKIFEQNLSAIRKQGVISTKDIEEVNLDNYDGFVIEEGKTGLHTIKVKNSKGNYVYLHSAYYPDYEADEIVDTLDFNKNRTLFVVAGIGLGYHVDALLKRINNKSVIIVIEKDPHILNFVFRYLDFSEDINKSRLIFVTANQKGQLKDYLKMILRKLFINSLNTQFLLLPFYDKEYIAYYREVFTYIGDIRNNMEFSAGNDIEDTIIGICNNIENMPKLINNPGLNQFIEQAGDKYKNKPAVVIASGPSLNKNIDLLKEIKGKGLLLACDGSNTPMLQKGIIPDVISSVERVAITYESFYLDKQIADETVLMAPAVVKKGIFDKFNTKVVGSLKSHVLDKTFNEMIDIGQIDSGISVAHYLFSLARLVGADPIILVGQDLAYGNDGITHVTGSEVLKKEEIKDAKYYVEDIYGEKIPTTFVWKQFLDYYENLIATTEQEVIDATEGGARIKGTIIMTLQEVIDKYTKGDIPKVRDIVDSIEIDRELNHKRLNGAIDGLNTFIGKFDELMDMCHKAIDENIAAYDLISPTMTQEDLDQVYDALEYVENEIIGYLFDNSDLMMYYQYLIVKITKDLNELGSEITFDVLKKNLLLQKDFILRIYYYGDRLKIEVRKSLDIFFERIQSYFPDYEFDITEFEHLKSLI